MGVALARDLQERSPSIHFGRGQEGAQEALTHLLDMMAPPSRNIHAVEGGLSDDRIETLSGPDTVYGHGGNDSIFSAAGDDLLFGGDGNDRLFGGAGDDRLFGGQGRDILIGGPGDDRLFGGAGANVAFFRGASGDYEVSTDPGTLITTVIDRRNPATTGNHSTF